MDQIPVIAIFDIGKTNKKVLLFDELYQIVFEDSRRFDEIKDEEGFPCEDINALTTWIRETFSRLLSDAQFKIIAVNFSAYGASFIYLDERGEVMLPLYNYLKPYPHGLQEKFYNEYGGRELLCRQTASPALGSLNSGLQLYRIKVEHPDLFHKVRYALHLPQYLSYVLCGSLHSELTSIGCHTHLWDFEKMQYHDWVIKEGLVNRFPEIKKAGSLAGYYQNEVKVGTGLHDSSAALIPYINTVPGPFVVLSTGTWCITLNPFNDEPLTEDELQQDCLCYLSFEGRQVKASRLFAGHQHEQGVKRLAEYFNKPLEYYSTLKYLNEGRLTPNLESRNLQDFRNYEDAYDYLMNDIIAQQVVSIKRVLGKSAQIFIDGGFSRNEIFTHSLADALPLCEVYTTSISQSSARGAAMVMHDQWNTRSKPTDINHTRCFGSRE
jgi:sugar (pentulose or hexulose) kinase